MVVLELGIKAHCILDHRGTLVLDLWLGNCFQTMEGMRDIEDSFNRLQINDAEAFWAESQIAGEHEALHALRELIGGLELFPCVPKSSKSVQCGKSSSNANLGFCTKRMCSFTMPQALMHVGWILLMVNVVVSSV